MFRASPVDHLTKRLAATDQVVHELRRFEQQLEHIAAARVELEQEARKLERQKEDELADVKKLQSSAFRMWLLNLLGDGEARLGREQQEYLIAAMASVHRRLRSVAPRSSRLSAMRSAVSRRR